MSSSIKTWKKYIIASSDFNTASQTAMAKYLNKEVNSAISVLDDKGVTNYEVTPHVSASGSQYAHSIAVVIEISYEAQKPIEFPNVPSLS